MIYDVNYSLRYQNSQGGRTVANPPSNPVHMPVLTPTAPTSGSSGAPIHATPTVDPFIPTFLYRDLPLGDEIGMNNPAESLLSGGYCADMDFCRYLPKLGCGYHNNH